MKRHVDAAVAFVDSPRSPALDTPLGERLRLHKRRSQMGLRPRIVEVDAITECTISDTPCVATAPSLPRKLLPMAAPPARISPLTASKPKTRGRLSSSKRWSTVSSVPSENAFRMGDILSSTRVSMNSDKSVFSRPHTPRKLPGKRSRSSSQSINGVMKSSTGGGDGAGELSESKHPGTITISSRNHSSQSPNVRRKVTSQSRSGLQSSSSALDRTPTVSSKSSPVTRRSSARSSTSLRSAVPVNAVASPSLSRRVSLAATSGSRTRASLTQRRQSTGSKERSAALRGSADSQKQSRAAAPAVHASQLSTDGQKVRRRSVSTRSPRAKRQCNLLNNSVVRYNELQKSTDAVSPDLSTDYDNVSDISDGEYRADNTGRPSRHAPSLMRSRVARKTTTTKRQSKAEQWHCRLSVAVGGKMRRICLDNARDVQEIVEDLISAGRSEPIGAFQELEEFEKGFRNMEMTHVRSSGRLSAKEKKLVECHLAAKREINKVKDGMHKAYSRLTKEGRQRKIVDQLIQFVREASIK